MPADCGLRGIAFVCVMQSHERDCSLDSASVLVGGVDDVGEHLGVGVAGAGGADGSASVLVGFVDQVDERAAVGATALAHGAQAVHSQTANHGILERHHVSFRWSKPWGFEFCLSASF